MIHKIACTFLIGVATLLLAAVSVQSKTEIHSSKTVEEIYLGDSGDGLHAQLALDHQQGYVLLGMSTHNPDVKNPKRAINVALTLDYNGKSYLQVVDPGTGRIMRIDLVEIAQMLNPKIRGN